MEQIKILVVDDESRMRKLVHDFLAKQGFAVLEAENGEAAVDIEKFPKAECKLFWEGKRR